MTACIRIWALSGAIGGGIFGIARANAEATLWQTAGELALFALIHALLGAAVGLLLAVLIALVVKLPGLHPEPRACLRTAGVLVPAIVLPIVLKAALTEAGGVAAFPLLDIFLSATLLSIGLGSLVALDTLRRSDAGGRAPVGRGTRAAGVMLAALVVVLAGARIAGYSAESLEAMIRRAARPAAAARGPSVILLSVDTLRPDYLSCNGGRAATPSVDALAAESFVFTNARSVAPWTRPSFASFFSGLYPSEMGVARLRGHDRDWQEILPALWREDVDTLAERLRNAGWFTGAITNNPFLAPWARTGQGLEVHYDLPLNGRSPARRMVTLSPLRMLLREENLPFGTTLPLQRARHVTDAATRMIAAVEHRPLMLWAHYMDPHTPYDPPGLEPDRAVSLLETGLVEAARTHRTSVERERFAGAYTREIEYFDLWLGHMIDELKRSGLWESSIVVLWSDHGEEFWEHGGWDHGQSLYDELLRVPLMVHMPRQRDGVIIEEPVSLLDMMPTILDLCSLPVTEELQGRSLAPILHGVDVDLPVLECFLEACHRGGTRKGLLFGDHKLIYHVYQDRFELHDLARDPAEQQDIFGMPGAPDTSAQQRRLREFTEASFAQTERLAGQAGATELSPEARQQMRDLGYVR